jgi:Na+/melibiose symporter-like transporter
VAAAGTYICPNTILADIVDYGTLNSGHNNAGSYYAIYSLSTKIGLSVGAGLALAFAGLFDFDISSTPVEIEKSTFFIIFLGVPIALNILSYIFIFSFPLTRRKQAIIRRRLDQRILSNEGAITNHSSNNQLNTKR